MAHGYSSAFSPVRRAFHEVDRLAGYPVHDSHAMMRRRNRSTIQPFAHILPMSAADVGERPEWGVTATLQKHVLTGCYVGPVCPSVKQPSPIWERYTCSTILQPRPNNSGAPWSDR